jgi:hypothetical protein
MYVLGSCSPRKRRLGLATMSIACCRRLWLERNCRTFGHNSALNDTIIMLVADEFAQWTLAKSQADRREE